MAGVKLCHVERVGVPIKGSFITHVIKAMATNRAVLIPPINLMRYKSECIENFALI